MSNDWLSKRRDEQKQKLIDLAEVLARPTPNREGRT